MQGAWVWSLVEGLRSHMLLGTAKKIKINKITKRKKLWGVKDAKERKAKRWDWVEGENLATSVQKRMLWREGLAFGVSQVQDRWARGAGDQAADKVPVGVVRPCCSPLHRATGPVMLADSKEIRTNRETYLPQGPNAGLVSFRNNEPFIGKIKTDSRQKTQGEDTTRQFTEKEIQITQTHVKDSWPHA